MKYSNASSTALIVAVSLAVIFVSGCTTIAAGEDLKAGMPDNSSFSITVIGGTNGPVTLSYADIKALGLVKKDGVTHPGRSGTNVTDDYVGVPLLKVLEKAGLPARDHAYNVTGLDGDSVVYTKVQAERGILALKKNGTALAGDRNDPITLILPGGPFCHWIPYPARIEIVAAKDGKADGKEGAGPHPSMSMGMPMPSR